MRNLQGLSTASSTVVAQVVKYSTPINFYIYPLIAIPTCVITGYLFSLVIPVKEKNIEELVYSRKGLNSSDENKYQ